MDSEIRYPHEEVAVVRDFHLRYTFHNLVVRPLFSSGNRLLRQGIFELIKEVKTPVRSIIDVSAGDDTLIAELGHRFQSEVCLANDVSVHILCQLRARVSSGTLIGVNHNALELPETLPCFDLAIVKNVFHHMKSSEEVDRLLANLRSAGRNILIVDVQDPTLGSWSCRAWHFYYDRWLRDQGHRFLTWQAFQNTIRSFFANKAELHFRTVSTPKGVYMLALIIQKEEEG